MSKEIQIPINNFEYFTTDGTYAGIKFRYRLKVDESDTAFSRWSEINELIFKDSSNNNLTLSEINGYDKPTALTRASTISSLATSSKLMPSQIDQIISQTDLSTTFNPSPINDMYRLSWNLPTQKNIGNFDIFLSWRNIVYLHPTANIGTPSGSAGAYTGTITLTGGGASIKAQTLKSFYEWFTNTTGTPNLVLYAAPGTSTPGNTFTVTGYTGNAGFTVSSANTWTSSGNIINISRNTVYTTPQYVATISDNKYEFSRAMKSSVVSANISAGSSIISLDTNPALLNLCTGMKLKKVSGSGAFGENSVISQIDYQNNKLFVSTSDIANATVSANGTIGTVVLSNGQYVSIISGMSDVDNLEVGYMLYATDGTGSFGDGIVRVSSILSTTAGSSSIGITSNKTFSAGTVTNIGAFTPNNHSTSGDIKFYADASSSFDSTFGGKTFKNYWSIPHYCQAIVCASTLDKDYTNLYTFLTVSEAQHLYFGGLGKITSSTTSAPFTAVLDQMSMPYSSSPSNSGAKIYANPVTTSITAVTPSSPTAGKVTYTATNSFDVGDSVTISGLAPSGYNGTFTITNVSSSTFSVTNSTTATVTDNSGTATSNGSFGSGQVTVSKYTSGNSINLVSTAAITNGLVYGIRL